MRVSWKSLPVFSPIRYHIGRLIEFLKKLSELDNTLVMVLSDNGASSREGRRGW